MDEECGPVRHGIGSSSNQPGQPLESSGHSTSRATAGKWGEERRGEKNRGRFDSHYIC